MSNDEQQTTETDLALGLPARKFAGRRYDLVWSEQGYLLEPATSTIHTPDCEHAPSVGHSESSESVRDIWTDQATEALIGSLGPQFCLHCVVRRVDDTIEEGETKGNPEQLEALGQAAELVLSHLFGDGRSVIDPTCVIWTGTAAEHLRAAIQDNMDLSSDTFFEKLRKQLDGAPREVILLAAEAAYLRSLPVMGLRPETKLGYIEDMLSWLPDNPPVPEPLRLCLQLKGAFQGGQGYNQFFWQHLIWIAHFTKTWVSLDDLQRRNAREDPWTMRTITQRVEYAQPSIANTLKFLAFPFVFEYLISDRHKKAVLRGLKGLAPSVELSGDLDHDLYLLRQELQQKDAKRINWFDEPWYSSWQERAWEGTRAWGVQPRTEDPTTIDSWVAEGTISYDVPYLKALEPGEDFVTVRNLVFQSYTHLDYTRRLHLAEEVHTFLSRMDDGDAVAVRRDAQVWVGRVVGDAIFDSELGQISRDIEWGVAPLGVDHVSAEIRSEITESPGVIELHKALPFLQSLVEQTDELPLTADTVEEFARPDAMRRADPALADQLHIDRIWLNELISLLEERRQIILYGPPGTGKTYLAQAVARHLTGQDPEIVQFHPSYAYEDFFEGYRPSPTESGGLGFDLKPGPLRRLAAKATNDPQRPYVLIVDEINRGNLAKIFGELYFLLEYRDEHIRLQYSSGETFRLPPNLYIIGTMNTADRSIAMVDTAIRRRFAFLEMHPDSTPVAGLLDRWLLARGFPGTRARLLEALNAELGEESRDQHIGPSYLMREQAATDEGLERIWKYDLLPLLEEHFYGIHSPAEVAERFSYRRISRQLPPGEGASNSADSVL